MAVLELCLRPERVKRVHLDRRRSETTKPHVRIHKFEQKYNARYSHYKRSKFLWESKQQYFSSLESPKFKFLAVHRRRKPQLSDNVDPQKLLKFIRKSRNFVRDAIIHGPKAFRRFCCVSETETVRNFERI